jgi:hypothetical protein
MVGVGDGGLGAVGVADLEGGSGAGARLGHSADRGGRGGAQRRPRPLRKAPRFGLFTRVRRSGTLVEGQVVGQPLDVLIAGDDAEAKDTVARLARDGRLRAIDVGPLERARQLEGLGFLGIALQQPMG